MKPAATPPAVHRVSRRPDPWAWPDWRYVGADGTFGNRYDDPQGVYRVLYASTQRLAAFVEVLAVFRPDPAVAAELAAIAASDGDDEPPAAGVVPAEWTDTRSVGVAELVGDYVDIGHHTTLAELRRALSARVVHHRLGDLDAATIRLSVPRAFTQEISRHVFDATIDGHRRWNGIAYQSRHGDDFENWAIFEPATPGVVDVTPLDEHDPDLHRALAVHGLRLAPRT